MRHGTRHERVDRLRPIGPGPIYWGQIERALDILADKASASGIETKIAIEGVRAPGGFRDGKRQFAKPIDILALGATFGAIYATRPDAVIVPPGGNGSGMLSTYPADLITPAELRAGVHRKALSGSLVSHARSAYDVAGLAPRIRRVA
jgi:hypothetical protein